MGKVREIQSWCLVTSPGNRTAARISFDVIAFGQQVQQRLICSFLGMHDMMSIQKGLWSILYLWISSLVQRSRDMQNICHWAGRFYGGCA